MKVVVYLANGFEEIEALSVVDVLRRAGLQVVTAAVGGVNHQIQSTHGVTVTADCDASDMVASEIGLTVFPGGMPGATNLAECTAACKVVKAVYDKGGIVAAICAAPYALNAAGVLEGHRYTCYPGFEKRIDKGTYTGARVEVDANVVTACGPGASLEFAFELLKQLGMLEAAAQLKQGMLVK